MFLIPKKEGEFAMKKLEKYAKLDCENRKYIGIALNKNIVDNDSTVRAGQYVMAWGGYALIIKAENKKNKPLQKLSLA